MPDDVVALARQAAAATAFPAFDVTFDQAFSFSGRFAKPLVLLSREQNPALKEFNKTLGQAMASVGLGNWVAKSFKPHVTLVYDKQGVPAQPIAPLRWTVKDFVLVRSLVGLSHYDRLATWPLRAPAP